MRSLNKIIFINSASFKYAEVNIDGNVHFIGTQGVGKSALLRAILFFYNTDKIKLGIPKEKKSFDEYYFPFQNSYIIYEVMKESGAFSVLAFKSQGRVAFRFFDSAFDKNFFIDPEGRAFESWDKTRESFGRHVNYTRIIRSYEDFRNIIYGNNKGLQPEFRKYSLLESKQYQNIPRTIQNVFLNSKLDAEFIKETIIKSLNEDEIKIDLTTYSHNHLRDFETNLNDIKKWTDRNRKGESVVENQANNVSTLYLACKHLEKKKADLARTLGWALANLEKEQPKYHKRLELENESKDKLETKRDKADSAFKIKEKKIGGEISILKDKLAEIKRKQDDYSALKIQEIIERVGAKNSLVLEQKNLHEEKEILSSKFMEITHRYESLLKKLENELEGYENLKQNEKNQAKEANLHFHEEVNGQYEILFDEIKTQHAETLLVAQNAVEEKNKTITNLKIRRSEIRNKRYYEEEIEKWIAEIGKLQLAIVGAENEMQQAEANRKNFQKEWELEESRTKEGFQRKIDQQSEARAKLTSAIANIDRKIEQSKDSLYGWLNNELPGWENTIGKVIDEENVLFAPGLNPEKIAAPGLDFFGIRIDLNEIDKTVKTLTDYEKEKSVFAKEIQSIEKNISGLFAGKNNELDKLKKKFQTKIRLLKDAVQNNDYLRNQSKIKLDEATVRLNDFRKKAELEKIAALDEIDNRVAQSSEELIEAQAEAKKVEANIAKQINLKKKEKENKLKAGQQKLADTITRIDTDILTKKTELAKKEATLKNAQKLELHNKGADTEQLEKIETRLASLNFELKFIEDNTPIVERYKYDKEQLFDKEDDFKNKKNQFEKKLDTELVKHNQQKEKLRVEIKAIIDDIETTRKILQAFEDDFDAYKDFQLAEVFLSVDADVGNFTDENKTDRSCKTLIDDINRTHYNGIERYTELQEATNKFTGNFQENNIFRFKTKFIEKEEYFKFADELKEFVDEDKITEYKKRVEERFAHIIRQIGKETGELISKEGEIHGVISDINKDFVARNFVGAIKRMELRTVESANRIVQLLIQIKNFNDENILELGEPNLFTSTDRPAKNEKAIELLKQLIKEMSTTKEQEISLSDSFELQFQIVENDNDTGWVEKLSNVGSDGTDVLVKAMINIMLLNVFKDRASKKQKDDFRLHCMMDEIGKLHPTNVKGILKFANDRNILLINSSPTTYNATDYRYTYLLSKDLKNVTTVKRLVRKISKPEPEPTIQS